MVLGFFEGSRFIFAFKYTCPAIVVVVSSPRQTRFICWRISSGMDWPSAEPDTIDHSACNGARSFLTASFSAAQAGMRDTATSPMRDAIWNVFMLVVGCCDVLLPNDPSSANRPARRVVSKQGAKGAFAAAQ